jgi:hypothetical protein
MISQQILFHLITFHGKDGAPSTPGYISTDPLVIGDQLTCMQKFGYLMNGRDDAGVVILTYGPFVSSFIHQASMEIARQCGNRRMPFVLMFDPWTVRNAPDKNAAMLAVLKHPDTISMLNSRAYLSGAGPVLDFSTGVDPKAIVAAIPGFQYWMRHVDYSWPETGSNWLTQLKTDNANPAMKLPALMLQFNDGTGPDKNKSVWDQSAPARVIPSMAGNTFYEMAALIPSTASMVQMVTWNDYAESTAIEPFAAMLRERIGE